LSASPDRKNRRTALLVLQADPPPGAFDFLPLLLIALVGLVAIVAVLFVLRHRNRDRD
jgi:hypothetical protein